ncbi:NADPH-dependent FMN reductase [Sulfuriroseicoccus oceanibius]|uniref:NAD(P)H-dependent oxidoreductase n=1 Tax=Sulfuriroseicoccus oceanibius TaxID=2707525 RepID=A0A6B3LCY5_9BACT|nr:NAD(P)H-dependent oxidoreductase [Sulfuriroseicoccus oceanibius]QQL45841.1 NAD(P)H-dependent oxidoreductase [Sulfuriroseicoccus oceanibius]
MTPKLLALAGSSRDGSLNFTLLKAVAEMARTAGAEVTVVDQSALEFPLFNQDLEARDGLPPEVKELKALMLAHDGLIIASPEYNSSITPLLKNAIDWCSRPSSDDEESMAAYRDKTALLVSASPGGFGGMRALNHLRDILLNIRVAVYPKMHSVGDAYSAFGQNGEITDHETQRRLVSLVTGYVEFAGKLG